MFKKYRIKAILKSGRTIGCKCNDFDIASQTNDLTRINIKNDDGNWPHYVRLDDISVINMYYTIYGRILSWFH